MFLSFSCFDTISAVLAYNAWTNKTMWFRCRDFMMLRVWLNFILCGHSCSRSINCWQVAHSVMNHNHIDPDLDVKANPAADCLVPRVGHAYKQTNKVLNLCLLDLVPSVNIHCLNLWWSSLLTDIVGWQQRWSRDDATPFSFVMTGLTFSGALCWRTLG